MYAPEIAAQIVNACAILHNMRLHYRLPLMQDDNIIEDLYNVNNINDDEVNEALPHRGPRAVAQRIQKQLMLEWFPNYRCAWDN